MHEFGAGIEAFGIVTPETPQGAPFEKDGRPYTRPVVDRIALDVEYPANHGGCASMLRSMIVTFL
jgi:hypothetical protein